MSYKYLKSTKGALQLIFNISEAANLAIHALTYLANNPEMQPVSTGQVAEVLEASENHLSKVFQRLTKAGLVKSIRGPKGGFFLAWEPESITLLEIYEAIDGKLSEGSCLFGQPVCDRNNCVFGDLVSGIQKQVSSHFSQTTLGDLVEKK
ncbi:MAG: Rrf2 family transcriptional regulator [Proteobacteria bacterium]|nr:Rrf2 family transcriptional regulator [Pseudomonadota bacterium]